MKRVIIALVMAVSLSGCASMELHDFIPSFWDDNQSERIVDVRLKTERFDCEKPHLPQVSAIRDDLYWFQLYSESKGYLQKDVLALIAPMQETVEDFHKRSSEKEGSAAYCKMKVKILKKQASRAAEGVLGRF